MAKDFGPTLLCLTIVSLTLTWIATLMRVYTRIFLTKSFLVEDWLALASTIVYTVFSSFMLVSLHFGAGKPLSLIPNINDFSQAVRWSVPNEPIYMITTVLIKWALSIFLLRFCASPVLRWIIYLLLAIHTTVSAAGFVFSLVQCRPFHFAWTQILGDQNGTCDSFFVMFMVQSAVNCLADWVLAIIPIFIVRKIQLRRKTKIKVAVILAFGSVAAIISAIRFPYIISLGHLNVDQLGDVLYTTAHLATWSILENAIAIIASALVTVRPLLEKLNPSRWSSNNSPNKSHTVNLTPDFQKCDSVLELRACNISEQSQVRGDAESGTSMEPIIGLSRTNVISE